MGGGGVSAMPHASWRARRWGVDPWTLSLGGTCLIRGAPTSESSLCQGDDWWAVWAVFESRQAGSASRETVQRMKRGLHRQTGSHGQGGGEAGLSGSRKERPGADLRVRKDRTTPLGEDADHSTSTAGGH